MALKYIGSVSQHFLAMINTWRISTHSSPIQNFLMKVNQFSRLRIGAEIFGSTHSPRYIKSANILLQFVIDDNTTDIYPGQVQFFFEHMIQLPEGPATHSLAFVRWYDKADDRRSRFHCQIGNDDEKICNIELWKRIFMN